MSIPALVPMYWNGFTAIRRITHIGIMLFSPHPKPLGVAHFQLPKKDTKGHLHEGLHHSIEEHGRKKADFGGLGVYCARSYEVVELNINQIILAWRDDLRNSFYRAVGLPQVVPGAGGQSTESESKVIYLAFEGIVEREQKQIERWIWEQMGLRIDLYPPETLAQDLQTDNSKDGTAGFQPSDTTAGVGR